AGGRLASRPLAYAADVLARRGALGSRKQPRRAARHRRPPRRVRHPALQPRAGRCHLLRLPGRARSPRVPAPRPPTDLVAALPVRRCPARPAPLAYVAAARPAGRTAAPRGAHGPPAVPGRLASLRPAIASGS